MQQRIREIEAKQRKNASDRAREASEWQTVLKAERKKFYRHVVIVGALLLLAGVFVFNKVFPTNIQPPVNYSSAFQGIDCKDVKRNLASLGFKNIKLNGLNDIRDKDDPDLNKVTEVTIRGESDFVNNHIIFDDEIKTYKWNDLVIITYHSME